MKPHRTLISAIETSQGDADIVLRPVDISQAEADIFALRAQPDRPDNIKAADALQQAVDVARAQMMCPALYAAGSKHAQGDDVIAASALKLFRFTE